MKFKPSEEWRWIYGVNHKDKMDRNTYLKVSMLNDLNESCLFTTHFKKDDLHLQRSPKNNQPLCVEDVKLLGDYQEGLYEISILNDEQCLNIALNAVACARFVRLTNPVSDYFKPCEGNAPEHIYRGLIVSLLANDEVGALGDFIVLDDDPQDGIYRLMLVNDELTVFGFKLNIGQMVRVNASRFNEFRIKRKRTRYA